MFEALRTLRSLSPEQKTLLKSKQLAGEYTPRALIDLLRPLADFDRQSDKARMPIGCSSAGLFVLSIALLVLAGNVSPYLLPLPVLALGAAIWFLVTVLRLGKLDLSNNLRQVALPLFAVLDEDMEQAATMNVRLDFSSPTAKEKKTGKGEPYKLGIYHKVVDTTYRDAWFAGGTRLADGSVLQWDVTDDVVESTRTKSTGRKTKIKTKYRKATTITVDVALPNKEYAVADLPVTEGGKVKVREGEKRTTFRLSRRVKAKSIDPVDARELFDAISEAYRRVRPAAATGSAS